MPFSTRDTRGWYPSPHPGGGQGPLLCGQQLSWARGSPGRALGWCPPHPPPPHLPQGVIDQPPFTLTGDVLMVG